MLLTAALLLSSKDPDFLAEAKKVQLDVNPLTGEEVKSIVDGLFKLNPTIVAKLSNILTVE